MLQRLQLASLLLAALRLVQADDLTVYQDGALAAGWENWSWSSTIDFAATDIFEGTSSVSVDSEAWSALSVKLEGTFPQYAGLRFDIVGAQPDLSIYFSATDTSTDSPSISLSAISKTVTADEFSSLLIDFSNLPGLGSALPSANWDRISFQGGQNGASYHLDNIVLVESIVVQPEFLSAEPLVNNVVALTTVGTVNLSSVSVKLNGKSLRVSNTTTYSPPDTPSKTITYFSLSSSFAPGQLVITADNFTAQHTIPTVRTGSINQAVARPINPHVYGVNFPKSADYIQTLGVTLSRWGGNAVTAYNPFGTFTNAGADWYFENRVNGDGDADDWLGWVDAAGSDTLLTVPALDWVAKDATSYSYPKTLYPDQGGFDPFNADAGNGALPNGTDLQTDPTRAYTPWNSTAAKQWLSGLKNKPTFVAIDNEIEIASSTHRDMHFDAISYDEELQRMIEFGTVAKQALPNVQLVAPSTNSWWFYWTSVVGLSDNAAHNNTDFLPWFLRQMAQHDKSTKTRLLDYLDIHYYYAADTSANDDAAKALRLRAPRSLWDPSYVDESWIGTSVPQNHEPNPTIVQLIPRMKTLIAQNYPGTKLSISEWNGMNEQDITGGLATADSLGAFGRYGVDAATYWGTADALSPTGLAFWLFRGHGTNFGSSSVQVNLATDPNTASVYAATEKGKLSLVILNKNPSTPLSYSFSNLPAGSYFLRHFGGASGAAKWQTTISLKRGDNLVIPPYTAVFLLQQ